MYRVISDTKRFMALLPFRSHILTSTTSRSDAHRNYIYKRRVALSQKMGFLSKSYMPSINEIPQQNQTTTNEQT